MRKYIHTALIIFAIALPCFGQWTEVWTNGDLFAVNEMASQCYSASVERCVAVGVTPNSPSWFDYLLGKNHAKLVSVKANIAACVPYYVKSGIVVSNCLATNGVITWESTNQFTTATSIPVDFFSSTPYFKTQYPSESNGWHNTKKAIQILTQSAFFKPTYECGSTNFIDAEWSGSSTNSFSDAYANVVYIGASSIFGEKWATDGVFTLQHIDGTKYIVIEKVTGRFWWEASYSDHANTNFDSYSSIYVQGGSNSWINIGIAAYSLFDSQNSGITTNYSYWDSFTILKGTTASLPFRDVGDSTTNITATHYSDIVTLAELPENVNTWFMQGWDVDSSFDTVGFLVTHDFTATGLTNGFRYK